MEARANGPQINLSTAAIEIRAYGTVLNTRVVDRIVRANRT
jgi:hypothetical protein